MIDKEVTKVAQSVQEKPESYFDGGFIQLLGWIILGTLVTSVTLGICYPFAIIWLYSWEAKHTVINGKRLKFTGTAGGLFGTWIICYLLTVITVGIYGFYVPIKIKKWRESNTFFEDEVPDFSAEQKLRSEKVSYFDGGFWQWFGWSALGFLVTVLSLGICLPWAFQMFYSWEQRHKVCCNKRFSFDGTARELFGTWIVCLLLTIITLGIYGFWVPIRIIKWKVKHTHFSVEMEKSLSTNKRKKWNDEAVSGLIFVLPPVIGFFLFTAGPFLFSIFASFTEWDSMTTIEKLFSQPSSYFIGFDNYVELFTDEFFWKALFNTFFYMIGIPIGMVWAFALAMSFNKELPGVKVYRVIYYIPVVSSIVAVALLWSWLYNGDYGLLNQFLAWIGIPKENLPNWLQNKHTVKPALIAMTVWRGVGGTALLYLGALQNMPKSYYEAAVIDGANGWKIFSKITWPLMSPITFYIVVTGIIGGAQMIVEPQIMTPDGGHDYSSATIVFYIWQHAFGSADEKGYACAAAWVLAIIIFAITALQFKLNPASENYLE